MEQKRVIPMDTDQTEEDRLRTRHLRAFAATAGRLRQERLSELSILTNQPPLPKGLGLLNLIMRLQ